jgi:DNA-binding winged helix-turn-helix (wHTH) protein/TolB-like protein/Flp pilus assembly protein TadD
MPVILTSEWNTFSFIFFFSLILAYDYRSFPIYRSGNVFRFPVTDRLQGFQGFGGVRRRKKHVARAGKLQSVTGTWFIIGLFDYRLIYTFDRKFCLSDFRKVFGKELETTNGSKNGGPASGERYAFGDFVIDPADRTCVRGGVGLPITGKVFDVLLVFVTSPGRLLTKDELMERVWSDEFVEEGNLARNVSTLRKILGDTEKQHRYIATVPGHGYRFVAEVRPVDTDQSMAVEPIHVSELRETETEAIQPALADQPKSRKIFWALAALIVIFTVAWFGRDRLFTSSPTVKSLAVLPLRGVDPNDNYLGVGIADAVIRRISLSGQVTVRPTSAVLHYLNQDADTLAAARELNADAVLEGNVQRSGDRLRVSVNLLRTADGTSIWNDSFDLQAADIFRVQDEVAQEVADKLKIQLGSTRRAGSAKYPTDPAAYESYVKGIFSFDQRGFTEDDTPQMMETIGYFKRSLDIDPNYALAHAQLAVCYAWMALFIKPGESQWADLARQEIARSQELDHELAESHLANALLLWSAYGNYQIETGIIELRTVKRLDPNYAGADLAAFYGHIGLEDQAVRELNRARVIDPTSQSLKGVVAVLPYLRGDPDGWKSVYPEHPLEDRELAYWYYLRKGSLDLAQKIIDERLSRSPNFYDLLMQRALLYALRGNFSQAEVEIPNAFAHLPHNAEDYHHETYDTACIYALEGKSGDAVKWLRETADTGFPNYPLFARDPFLDRIRQSPEFVQFLSEQKSQWELFEQEFPDA